MFTKAGSTYSKDSQVSNCKMTRNQLQKHCNTSTINTKDCEQTLGLCNICNHLKTYLELRHSRAHANYNILFVSE